MPAADPSDLYDEPMPPEAFRPDDAPDLDVIDIGVLPEDEYLDPGSPGHRAQHWEINSDGEAQWAMAHVAEVAAEESRLEVQFAAWRENLTETIRRRQAPLKQRREFFEERLIDYARRLREANPKAKTLVLPSGDVASRGSKAMVTVEDPVAFLKWADLAERVDLFEIEKKPMVSPIRQAINVVNIGSEDDPEWRAIDPATGEEVPGLAVRPPHVDFTVRPR